MGWLCLEERRKWRARLEPAPLLGLRVLRAGVPAPSGLRERSLLRRIDQAALLLARSGVRRVLTAPGFPYWPLLWDRGLRPVDPAPLCRAMAAPLTLAVLARRGVPPVSAAVVLSGQRVDRDLFQAAVALCPQVRTLIIDAPSGGAELALYLRREFGAAVLTPESSQPVQAAVCFSPNRWEADALTLYGPAPGLLGFRLSPPLPLPEQVDPLSLTALLWEEGRLSLPELRLSSGASDAPAQEILKPPD